MKYLFVDMEWNQQKDGLDEWNHIISIGSIEVDKKTGGRKEFYRLIRPLKLDEIPEQTLHFLHLSRAVVDQAASIQAVLHKWSQIYMDFDRLIVWNRKIGSLFLQAFSQCGIVLPKQAEMIILQEVLSESGGANNRIGFEKALAVLQIPYDKNMLHIAKHDVRYLMKVFWSYQNQSCMDEKEGSSVCADPLLIAGPGNVFTEKKIEQICNQFHMNCYFAAGVIFIATPCSNWRIYYEQQKVTKVLHENYKQGRGSFLSGQHKHGEGYHHQVIKKDNLYEILRYMKQHDERYLQQAKKMGMDRII